MKSNNSPNRMFRGCSYNDDNWYCQSSYRYKSNPKFRNLTLSLRLSLAKKGKEL